MLCKTLSCFHLANALAEAPKDIEGVYGIWDDTSRVEATLAFRSNRTREIGDSRHEGHSKGFHVYRRQELLDALQKDGEGMDVELVRKRLQRRRS